jgi:ketosteroid isomerase-like protein
VSRPNAGSARRILELLSEGDVEAFVEFLDPEIEIHTRRGARRGVAEAATWAGRRYLHLVRRYKVDELQEAGDRVLVLAEVQYVWRESGKVGHAALVGIVLEFRAGKLRRWRLYEDPMEALEELED